MWRKRPHLIKRVVMDYGAVKFEKGSKEWRMFNEFWKLCQKFWIVEDDDAYWQEFISDMNDFYKKYDKSILAKGLGLALANLLDEEFYKKYRNGGKREIETWKGKK